VVEKVGGGGGKKKENCLWLGVFLVWVGWTLSAGENYLEC